MSISVYVNGKKEEFEKELTVAELLNLKKLRPEVLTVELNDEIVKKDNYDSTVIKEGDRVEIIFFMGGGSNE